MILFLFSIGNSNSASAWPAVGWWIEWGWGLVDPCAFCSPPRSGLQYARVGAAPGTPEQAFLYGKGTECPKPRDATLSKNFKCVKLDIPSNMTPSNLDSNYSKLLNQKLTEAGMPNAISKYREATATDISALQSVKAKTTK